MSGRQQRREEKRQLILTQAAELFYKRGYGSTSMQDIAVACNLGMNAIYSVFCSKEQVCAEVFMEAQHRFVLAFEQCLLSQQSLSVKNRQLLDLYIGFYARHNFLYEIVWQVLEGQIDSEIRPQTVSDIHDCFVRLVEGYARVLEQAQENGYIRSDLESRTMAAALWSMMSGMASNYAHGTEQLTGVAHDAIRETGLAMVLEYLKYTGGD